MRNWASRMLWLTAVAFLVGAPRYAAAQINADQFQKDLKSICASPSRVIGSRGYDDTVKYVREQIEKLSNVDLQEQEFPVMVPQTRFATLATPGRKRENIYPFWPAKVRVNSTPAGGITGHCVYVRMGGLEEIPAQGVRGQIAVIEASAGDAWQQVAYFGARAILVLGTDGPDRFTTHVDLRSHDLTVPINIPRFYVPPGSLCDDLRAGRITGDVTLDADVRWVQATAHNLYALVRPARQTPSGWKDSRPPAALMISVPIESSGLVPDLAQGASQAVNTAAGLALLRDIAARPWDRPVIVFFSGADSIELLGTRQMFMALSDVPRVWRKQLDDRDAGPVELQKLAEAQDARLNEVRDDPSLLDATKDRDVIDRVTKIIETDGSAIQEELFRLRLKKTQQSSPELDQQIKDHESRYQALDELRFVLQKQPATLKTPDGARLMPDAKAYIQRTIERLNGRGTPGTPDYTPGVIQDYADRQSLLNKRIWLYQHFATELGLDRNPDDRNNNSRLIELLVSLDLSDCGSRVGPMSWGFAQRYDTISQIQEYRDWFSKLRNPPAWLRRVSASLDLIDPLSGTEAKASYLAAPLALACEMCPAWGVPGFSLVTLDDLRLRRDTPTDTLKTNTKTGAIASPSAGALLPQLIATRELLMHAWNDLALKAQPELKWQHNEFQGQTVSLAAGRPVPDLPRPGFLATYYYALNTNRIPQLRTMPWTLGMRRCEVVRCNAAGSYRFEGLPKLNITEMFNLAVQVYRMRPEDRGRISATNDLGKQSGDISIYADLHNDVTPLRSVVFDCSEFSLVGLYDPRFLQNLGEVLPLDARRNDVPQRYNMTIGQQMMAGFAEPGSRLELLFRYGRVGNRLVLLNMPPEGAGGGTELGDGFTVDELNNLGPLSVKTGDDFYRLNSVRLEKYRAAGVSSSLVDQLQAQAAADLKKAIADEDDKTVDPAGGDKTGSAAQVTRDANIAWANEARVYSATTDMANDVVRGAIFLLLLCVPFSFAMERLLIGSPNIYKQIAGGVAIFAVMTLVLWSFHPAFKISSSPLIIILAFAIIFMSLVVMNVVYTRFDTELKKIRSGRGSAQGTSVASASVLMAAVLLGIANMRKRRFRTALTSITIVLITFAVLCFTSSSVFLDTTTLPTGYNAAYPGVMLRQRGWRPMPTVALENLRSVLGSDHKLVQQWWNVNAADPKETVRVSAAPVNGKAPAVFSASAVLGLSPGESDLSPIAQVIGVEKFRRLESGERNIVYMSRVVADQLHVEEGDDVRIDGISLHVAGIFDAEAYDKQVITLAGEPLAPLNYTSGLLDSEGKRLDDTSSADSFDLDTGSSAAELSSSYEHLSSSKFVIVPAAISRMLPNASLKAVSIRLSDFSQVKPVSDDLAKRFAVAIFAGFDDGVKMVAANNSLPKVSGGGVAVPLAIAGLIIFNTMMGSIAERRREIHVYTSLGLAPMHVGALFVAEALTYGLIGTVFGYVIGQGVGTLMDHFHLLGKVTLNYSGTSAIMTMGLILLIVLLSALVPARLAAKIAAPSIERSWKVPLPKGDEILAVLPFTINKTAADGALAYLAEFFEAHQEGSIGKFSSGKVEAFVFEDDAHRSSRGLKTVIWLTPFDLGVRQHLMLLIHPGQYEDIYEVQVVLQRLSGDDGSWYRMNRTFLTELRKQFLQWRSLTPQRMLQYVEESKQLFAKPPEPEFEVAAR